MFKLKGTILLSSTIVASGVLVFQGKTTFWYPNLVEEKLIVLLVSREIKTLEWRHNPPPPQHKKPRQWY